MVGIATVDLKSGKFKGVDSIGDMNPYQLICGEKSGELIVVNSRHSGQSLIFGLTRFNMKDGTSQVIGSFPKVFWGGWPSIFSVSDGILWASFPVKGVLSPHPNSGEVYKMDMASGKV